MTKGCKVTISKQAEWDFEEIYHHIAEESPSNAVLFVNELESAIRSLDLFPERCPVIPEMVPLMYDTYRHLIHKSYRIIFVIRPEQIVIMRIIHGAREIESSKLENNQ